MPIALNTLNTLADRLESAERERQSIVKITDAHPELDWADAYAIQYELRRRRLARSHRLVGLKMGLTSFAKMKQMGVEQPIYGFLTDDYVRPDGGLVEVDQLIHPKVEAEIAFVLKKPLRGPGVHVGQVLDATDFIVPAVEIIDSRYRDFKFDLKSVVADNCSSARFVTGGRARRVDELDLRTLGIVIEKNGVVIGTAAGAAVLGHPAASVAMLANLLAKRDEHIPAGCFVMTGGATEAYAVERGDHILVRYQDIGTVSLRFG